MSRTAAISTRRKIVFEHDRDPDFSWLEQDHYNPDHPSYDPVYESKEAMDAGEPPMDGHWYRDPENHVALELVVYELAEADEDWRAVDSLGGIDFIARESNWTTGTFYRVSHIPERCDYQRTLAREYGLPE